MLSEDGKTLILTTFNNARNVLELLAWEGESPKSLVKIMIGDYGSAPHKLDSERAQNVRDNLDEAAQYLAGLLGLM